MHSSPIPMPTNLTPSDYPALHQTILDILATGKERARQAIEQEKVRTYWEVGRTLHTHFLEHKDRAGYGEQVIVGLAQDLEMSERLLYDILSFYRAFPILHARVNSGCQVRIFSGIKSRTILGDKDYDAVRVSSFPCGLVPSDPAIFDIDVPRLIIPSGVLPFKRKEGPSK